MTDSIFVPNYDHTESIAGLIAEVHRHRLLIDNMLLMPKYEAWFRREAAILRASGTTRIEGASLDEQAVGELLRRNRTGKPTQDEQANLNAVEAYEFIDYLSDQADIQVDELVIRQINREFLHGAPQALAPGVYRKGQNTVGRYDPPNAGDVPSLMRSFALWLREEDGLDPIVKAAISHIHLVAIHPFWDGNGRTARGLATLLLQRSRFGFKKLISLDAALFDRQNTYFSMIERTLGTRYTSGYDATDWVEFSIETLRDHSVQVAGRLTDWHRSMTRLHELFGKQELSTRQADGFLYALRTGTITRAEYTEITGVSGATSSRDLASLVADGWLEPEGQTRARVYRPNQNKMEELSGTS